MIRKSFLTLSVALIAIISFSVLAIAQTAPSPEQFPNITIGNFGKMDERYYRGGQPLPGEYQALKDLGVNTVIDLRNDPTEYEKREVEALGMKYVNIPMSGWKYAKDTQVEEFMKLMNDPATGVVYAHCKAGKHRTGLTGAIYRFEKYGWEYNQAYKEMKNYDYTSWPVHYNIKTYVQEYSKEMKSRKPAITQTAAVGAGQGVQQ
ncbi:MAG: tyrosine-protein phosphatase [Blastocatellia bacterium]|nr:tyrosine-protein phosphatase [Blastocatellia bacterium]